MVAAARIMRSIDSYDKTSSHTLGMGLLDLMLLMQISMSGM